MSGDALAFVLFIIATASAFAVIWVDKKGWKHPAILPVLFVATIVAGLTAYGWSSILDALNILASYKIPRLPPEMIAPALSSVAFAAAMARWFNRKRKSPAITNDVRFLIGHFVDLNTALYLLALAITFLVEPPLILQIFRSSPATVSVALFGGAFDPLSRFLSGTSDRLSKSS